jgi:LysR family transcriptional repressor of citA
VIVQITESNQIAEMIGEGVADLGLSRMDSLQPRLTSQLLYEDPMLCVCPHDGGDMESSPPIDLNDLIREQLLFTHNHPGFWDDLLADLRRQDRPHRTMVVSQVHVTKRFIEEGLGFSFLPRSSVRRELLEGRMLEVDVTDLHVPTAATYVVTRNENEEVKRFKSFLGEYYG